MSIKPEKKLSWPASVAVWFALAAVGWLLIYLAWEVATWMF